MRCFLACCSWSTWCRSHLFVGGHVSRAERCRIKGPARDVMHSGAEGWKVKGRATNRFSLRAHVYLGWIIGT
jgi:hypothetical protein